VLRALLAFALLAGCSPGAPPVEWEHAPRDPEAAATRGPWIIDRCEAGPPPPPPAASRSPQAGEAKWREAPRRTGKWP
jgi:hypothetical protein